MARGEAVKNLKLSQAMKGNQNAKKNGASLLSAKAGANIRRDRARGANLADDVKTTLKNTGTTVSTAGRIAARRVTSVGASPYQKALNSAKDTRDVVKMQATNTARTVASAARKAGRLANAEARNAAHYARESLSKPIAAASGIAAAVKKAKDSAANLGSNAVIRVRNSAASASMFDTKEQRAARVGRNARSTYESIKSRASDYYGSAKESAKTRYKQMKDRFF